tara:strand:+ start:9091 stop:9594 length:504 start_codon:yes stop_codon:yes gene_type:complete
MSKAGIRNLVPIESTNYSINQGGYMICKILATHDFPTNNYGYEIDFTNGDWMTDAKGNVGTTIVGVTTPYEDNADNYIVIGIISLDGHSWVQARSVLGSDLTKGLVIGDLNNYNRYTGTGALERNKRFLRLAAMQPIWGRFDKINIYRETGANGYFKLILARKARKI